MSGTAGGGALRLWVLGLGSLRPPPSECVWGSVEGGTKPRARPNRCPGVPSRAGTCGLLRAARGTSCSWSPCELPLGPPSHRAAISLISCLHFVVDPSLLPSRASHLFARCLPSGGDCEARRDHLAVLLLRALPAPVRSVGRAGHVAQVWAPFATAFGLPRHLSAQRVGAFHKCWGTSSGLSWIIRFVYD